jgi:hypothetical protein
MVIVVGILAIVFLLLFTDTSGAYGRIITGLLSQSLKKQGWVFDVRTPSLMGLSLSGDSIVTRWENGPIFQITKPSLSVDVLPLFSTTVRGDFTGDLYDGPVKLDFSHSLIYQDQTLDGTLQDVNLSLIPFLRIYGVHSGLATVIFKTINFKKSVPVQGSISFSISEFKRSKEHINTSSPQARDARLVNFALDTVAAKLEVSKLEANANFKQDSIDITSISLLSSLGSATGTGYITGLQTSPGVDIGMHIILSEKGKLIIGPLLSLVPGFPRLTESSLAGLEARLSGPLSKPRWSFPPPNK